MAKRGASSRTMRKTLAGLVGVAATDLAVELPAVVGKKLPAITADAVKIFLTWTFFRSLRCNYFILSRASPI